MSECVCVCVYVCVCVRECNLTPTTHISGPPKDPTTPLSTRTSAIAGSTKMANSQQHWQENSCFFYSPVAPIFFALLHQSFLLSCTYLSTCGNVGRVKAHLLTQISCLLKKAHLLTQISCSLKKSTPAHSNQIPAVGENILLGTGARSSAACADRAPP